MIEPLLYFGIGFLFAGLFVWAALPYVRARTERLTARRLEAALQSLAETQAQKNRLRAEFATATRRFEQIVEDLKSKITSERIESGRKGDVLNRLKAETKMLKLEVVALQSQVEMPHEAAPTLLPAGEPCFLPLDASQREQFKNKTPELAKHGNDVVMSGSDFIPPLRG
jgi:predicted nuclease with TOPRIM domain